MRLRDHSQPCEHGFDQYHWLLDGNLCPGGREITEAELSRTATWTGNGETRVAKWNDDGTLDLTDWRNDRPAGVGFVWKTVNLTDD